MIFAISPGSDGAGPERYVAYLPFVLAPGANLAPIEVPIASTHGSLTLKLEKLDHLYALSSGPFPSVDTVAAHLDELRASLLWLSLTYGVGVSYSTVLGSLHLFEAPQPVPESGPLSQLAGAVDWTATDGHYDADKALIRPDHKRLTRWETGRVSVVVGISIESFFASLNHALSLEGLRGVIENEKLKLAIELYAAYRFELGDKAQLVTLVSALESLLPDMAIPECSNAALAQAKETVRASRDRYPLDSTEWGVINHLLSRVGALKTEAIGTTLRNHVSAVVSRHPELGDPVDVSLKLRDVYSLRSTLLHEGHSREQESGGHLSFLREFVPRLLAALFREAAEPAKT
jgi:hypothetical protein